MRIIGRVTDLWVVLLSHILATLCLFAPAAAASLVLELLLVIDDSWWHHHDYQEEVDRDEGSGKHSKSLDGHDGAQQVGIKGSGRGR
jgi:hypothetical protein